MSALINTAPITAQASAPQSGLPEWFVSLQSKAWETFQATPMPTRRDENWRFAKLKQLDFDAFVPATPLANPESLISRSNELESSATKFIFANEQLISAGGDLPEGVICLPLVEALKQHGDLVRDHFMKQETKLGSAKFAALHAAHLSSGVFIHVPKGIELEAPIEVYHWIGGENTAVFPHTLVITGEHAKVKVVDYFQSADDKAALCIAVNDLVAGTGSRLDYVAIQALNENSKMIQVNATVVGRDANAKGFIVNTGCTWARSESLSRLEGEGGNSDMLSVSIPGTTQEYDQRTFQHHAVPHTTSDLLYKNSLYDQARTVFSGLIFVDEKAHFTDAYQTCRNLMMSQTVEANSMPGLEINADQVKCSHGSTSAQIADEEIYYLRARGIDPVSARQLIARGFSVEAVEKLQDQALEELILGYVDRKFDQLATHGA